MWPPHGRSDRLAFTRHDVIVTRSQRDEAAGAPEPGEAAFAPPAAVTAGNGTEVDRRALPSSARRRGFISWHVSAGGARDFNHRRGHR
jgi:hypothetical protein